MLVAPILSNATLSAQDVPGGGKPPPGYMRLEYLAYVRESLDSLEAAWTAAWRMADASALGKSYAEDALLVPGGGAPLAGREKIVQHFGGALSTAGPITIGMIDFAASDNIAYEFGSFRFLNPAVDAHETTVFGHHVVVTMRYGRDWRIRAQLLLPTSGQPSDDWSGKQTVTAQPVSTQQFLKLAQQCRARSASRRGVACRRAYRFERVLGHVNAMHAEWRDAWRRDDVNSAAAVFAEEGFLLLPDEQPLMGREAIKSRLDVLLPGVRGLHSSVLDFAESGRMAYAYGRYFCQCGPGNDVLGHYISVHEEEAGNWRFRALILWADSG